MTNDDQIRFLRGRVDALTRIVTLTMDVLTPEALSAYLREAKALRPAVDNTHGSRMYEKGFMSAALDMETTIAMVAELKKRNCGSTPVQH